MVTYKCSKCGENKFYVTRKKVKNAWGGKPQGENCLKCVNCGEYYFPSFCNTNGLDSSEVFPNII